MKQAAVLLLSPKDFTMSGLHRSNVAQMPGHMLGEKHVYIRRREKGVRYVLGRDLKGHGVLGKCLNVQRLGMIAWILFVSDGAFSGPPVT